MDSKEGSSKKRRPLLGCIADDVTGATDLAINLVHGGMRVVQLVGVDSVAAVEDLDADAVVIALKTRSVIVEDAIEQTLDALRVLRMAGIQRFFFKYCSTFDSTKDGNIGPVADALLDELQVEQTIYCPALPRNGRTVYQGHLFVNGVLLHESGMESHPLNPMTDANLMRWLGHQTERKIGLLGYERLHEIGPALDDLKANGCRHIIVDACDEQHLKLIASSLSEMSLLTGGSGIARFLPNAYRETALLKSPLFMPTRPTIEGRTLIVAGSCSSATNKQVDWMNGKVPIAKVDVDGLMANAQTEKAKLVDWANAQDLSSSVLIASSASPELVSSLQTKYGGGEVARNIERLFAEVTEQLVSNDGFSRLIIAGGETSGAIVNQLEIRGLQIGTEICAGVPWTETIGERPLALALKSGNFGGDDFFETAMEMLP